MWLGGERCHCCESLCCDLAAGATQCVCARLRASAPHGTAPCCAAVPPCPRDQSPVPPAPPPPAPPRRPPNANSPPGWLTTLWSSTAITASCSTALALGFLAHLATSSLCGRQAQQQRALWGGSKRVQRRCAPARQRLRRLTVPTRCSHELRLACPWLAHGFGRAPASPQPQRRRPSGWERRACAALVPGIATLLVCVQQQVQPHSGCVQE